MARIWASQLIKQVTKVRSMLNEWNLGTEAYLELEARVYKENLRALNMVRFVEPSTATSSGERQYLDVGCGPGNFTKEVLLPRIRKTCSRIVAVDRCPQTVNYAMKNFAHRRIVHDVLDVEHNDSGVILQKYGAFDRLYSFLTFHYVADVARAYANVAKLLREGGECLVFSIVSADAIDAWDESYQMHEWKPLIINPRELFPGTLCVDEATRLPGILEAETRNSVSAAGLRCVAYQQYESRWAFGRLEDYLDPFMAAFKAYDGVPPERRVAFRNLWLDLLRERTSSVSGGQCHVTYIFNVVHAHKPRHD
ncbi:uncharacterized protein LOC144097251 isoform X2 [Amblyomma americanum]